jgi:hypothetical protein
LPFSADRVAVAESPDGAVFVAPEDPANASPAIAWVVDGNGPAQIAEHIPTGIAALAADGTNFYVATYSSVTAFDRTTGNQGTQWTLPHFSTANASNNDLVAMTAAGGAVFVSITQGDTVQVYRIDPGSSAAPHPVLSGLGVAIAPDGSIYSETTDHHLAVQRPGGSSTMGPLLAHSPTQLGGGVQYLDTVAGGTVWTSEPAGQGLDAQFSTYDGTSLAAIATYSGAVTDRVVDSAAGPLVLQAAGPAVCPESLGNSSSCVIRIDAHGTLSDSLAVGSAVALVGPAPAVVLADTATNQFALTRLS